MVVEAYLLNPLRKVQVEVWGQPTPEGEDLQGVGLRLDTWEIVSLAFDLEAKDVLITGQL